MKTSFHGSRLLFASAFAGLILGVCSVISTACDKYSSRIKRWNAQYEWESAKIASLNERQINAVD